MWTPPGSEKRDQKNRNKWQKRSPGERPRSSRGSPEEPLWSHLETFQNTPGNASAAPQEPLKRNRFFTEIHILGGPDIRRMRSKDNSKNQNTAEKDGQPLPQKGTQVRQNSG